MDHAFAEWLVGKVPDFQDDSFVVGKYFSSELPGYIVDRLAGRYTEDEGFSPQSEEGQEFIRALEVIGNNVKPGTSGGYWPAVQELLDSGTLDLYEIGANQLDEHLESVASTNADKLIPSLTNGIRALYGQISENGEAWLSMRMSLVDRLVGKAERSLSVQSGEALTATISELGVVDSISVLIRDFSKAMMGKPEAFEHASRGVWSVFDQTSTSRNIGSLYFGLLLADAHKLDDGIIDNSLNSIYRLAETEAVEPVDLATSYLGEMTTVERFIGGLGAQPERWLDLIRPADPSILSSRLALIDSLRTVGVVPTPSVAMRIVGLLPALEPDQAGLDMALTGLEGIADELSLSEGLEIYESLQPLLEKLGPSRYKALLLMARWHPEANPEDQRKFVSSLNSSLASSPQELVDVVGDVIPTMNEGELQSLLIELYKGEYSKPAQSKRISSTRLAVASLSDDKRKVVVRSVWNKLATQEDSAENFMSAARSSLSEHELGLIREEAISRIREVGAGPEAGAEFRILASTASSSVREIMPVVNLFAELYEGDENGVVLANKFAVPCLSPLELRSDHKHKLAAAMAAAARLLGGELEKSIRYDAGQLGLIGWRAWAYRKYWEDS